LPALIVCFHADADNCSCRKPKPGMILEAAARHRIDLATGYLVGDRWRDVHAGRSAGCRTVFVDYGYPQDQPHEPDKLVHSLREAADFYSKGRRAALTHKLPFLPHPRTPSRNLLSAALVLSTRHSQQLFDRKCDRSKIAGRRIFLVNPVFKKMIIFQQLN
jgi:HAD-hyrolase-like